MRLIQVIMRDVEPELEVSLPGVFSLHLYQYLLSSGLTVIWALKKMTPELESRHDSVGFKYPQN